MFKRREKGAKRYKIYRASDNLHMGWVWAKDELIADLSAYWFFRMLFPVNVVKEKRSETRAHEERVRRL